MRASTLRHRVKLQEVVCSADTKGAGSTETWLEIAKVWASITPISALERVESNARQETITHEITMRYKSQLTSADRIVYGSRIFNIKQILNPDYRNEMLTMLVEEKI